VSENIEALRKWRFPPHDIDAAWAKGILELLAEHDEMQRFFDEHPGARRAWMMPPKPAEPFTIEEEV